MNRKSSRLGFTLIELVVSALLASVMMVALFNIMWAALNDAREMKRNDRDRASVAQLVEVLHTDLQNARGMQVNQNELTLHGFLGARDGWADFSPGQVQYRRLRQGDQHALVRLSRSVEESETNCMWLGFGGFRIDVLAVEMEQDDLDGDLLMQPVETGGLPPMPEVFRVTLLGEKGNVLHSEVVHHHAI